MTDSTDYHALLKDIADRVQKEMSSTGTRSAKLATIDENFPDDPYYFAMDTDLPRVVFDGDTTLSSDGFATLYHAYIPKAGERVVMLPVGNTYVIVGSVDAPKRSTHFDSSFNLPTSLATYSTTPSIVATVDVADPGHYYHIEAYAQGEMGSTTAGTRWDAQIMYTDPDTGNTQIAIAPIPTGVTEFTQLQGFAEGISGPITVRLELKRVSGAANGQFTQFNSSFYVKVIPAQY